MTRYVSVIGQLAKRPDLANGLSARTVSRSSFRWL